MELVFSSSIGIGGRGRRIGGSKDGCEVTGGATFGTEEEYT